MKRIDFFEPLTALEIREPAFDVCKELARERDIYAKFNQWQQAALSGHSGIRRSQRERIGNGKHKEWGIDYQLDEPRVSRPRVIGRVLLRGPVSPLQMQFGGFDYGKFGEPKPTYSHITVHTPSELKHYRPLDPDADLLEATYNGLVQLFEEPYPRLFDVADYSSQS
ncbi:MAG TPA: hypothetical protein VFN56_04000 [Candidatus Saccharimonadales bacterium]|nr:hypothetical protein [Candidatus Saccharimonadales bacterium]